jgi:E3 ubiquitin-protein ligase TRIP12
MRLRILPEGFISTGSLTSRSSHDYVISWNNKWIYAATKQGLFPTFSADPQLFFTLGVLCAKALQMDLIVPLPFNPAFFKLLKGERVRLAEVDRELAESLKSIEGLEGLPFTVPGTDVVMQPSTVISPDNFAEYKKLVRDYICGSKLTQIVRAFEKGFSNLVTPKSWRLLTASELSTMVSGIDGSDISMTELVESVEVSHGYSTTAPQIKTLFEILLEMNPRDRALFFRFVTRADRLPVGGIRSLKPKLTVAKKGLGDDGSLPSVMTCTNYFKLPAYPTKDEMLGKLLYAIRDGQGTFLFT